MAKAAANKKAASATARKTAKAVTPAATRRASKARTATFTVSDVACRAYDLYLARGCAHGRDVDDWLQAERELRIAETANQA